MIMSDTNEKISNLKAKTYTARFLEAGIVKYNNETVLIKNENLFSIALSFKGCPIFINHQSINKDLKNLKEKSVGHISKIYIRDGWAWCDFVITNKKAVDLIESGYSISCAYIPQTFGIGGKYHNIAYDREIITAKGTHIAIVKNPRYEDVVVYENSKKKGNNMIKNIFKFKSKEKKEIENAKEKELELENSFVELDGKEVPLSEMVEAYNSVEKEKAEKKAEEEKKNVLSMESEVEVDGKKIKVSELVNSYKEYQNKCSEKADTEKKNKEDMDKKKKDEEKEKKNDLIDFEDLKKNKVKSEIKNSKTKTKSYVSDKEKYELGAKRYGPVQNIINKK